MYGGQFGECVWVGLTTLKGEFQSNYYLIQVRFNDLGQVIPSDGFEGIPSFA